MAKRLTGTEKWRKEWFQELTLKQKCLWVYLCDNCDLAGFWDENLRQVSFEMGVKITTADLESLKDLRIVSPGVWFIEDFCRFQYGTLPAELDPDNRVHKAVIRTFEKRSFDRLSVVTDSLSEVLDSPHGGAKDKNKDKEKEKDKDKNSGARPDSAKIVFEYMAELRPDLQKPFLAQQAKDFYDHHEQRNWIPKGATKQMVNWRAAVRTWFSKGIEFGKIPPAPKIVLCPGCKAKMTAAEYPRHAAECPDVAKLSTAEQSDTVAEPVQ